jgi:N-acetylglucosaminyldiphosphoundecaprenol N-acetyl-beta-D-mannosaminyltransferase
MPGVSQVLTPSISARAEMRPSCARVLGIPVHVVDVRETIAFIETWIQQRDRPRWIAMTNSHGIIEGFKHPDFKAVLESADLSLPDGMWTARAAGRRVSSLPKQVRAIDLLLKFCDLANRRGYSSFFYGDTEEVLIRLSARLKSQFPSLKISGTYSPPFRPVTHDEDTQILQAINAANPDVLWVGLGLPKQERWIYEHREKLNVPVIVAIGATFKFASGKVSPAPRRVSQMGLEWFWRLLTEPRKVWRRALVYGPQFALHTYLESKGLKKYG